jgi:hypothetical protein
MADKQYSVKQILSKDFLSGTIADRELLQKLEVGDTSQCINASEII